MSLESEIQKIMKMMFGTSNKSNIKDLFNMEKETEKKPTTTDIESKIVGSSWKSCLAYKNKGGLNFYGDKIKVNKNQGKFEITYNGPSTGLSIAHASGSKGDTLHQIYNVLICEINPFLASGKMKPNIDAITIKQGESKDEPKLKIEVPLSSSDKTWQLDRRGGWGHDPGGSKMKDKCTKIKTDGGECLGPAKEISSGKFGKITEYFITHTI
jgi:hypothetical protein